MKITNSELSESPSSIIIHHITSHSLEHAPQIIISSTGSCPSIIERLLRRTPGCLLEIIEESAVRRTNSHQYRCIQCHRCYRLVIFHPSHHRIRARHIGAVPVRVLAVSNYIPHPDNFVVCDDKVFVGNGGFSFSICCIICGLGRAQCHNNETMAKALSA